MDYLKAFLIGGLLCVIGQLLIDLTKLTQMCIRDRDYTRMTGQTRESIREENREEAGKIVKRQLVLEALQKDAGLEVSDEELDAEIAKMATETRTVEAVSYTHLDVYKRQDPAGGGLPAPDSPGSAFPGRD